MKSIYSLHLLHKNILRMKKIIYLTALLFTINSFAQVTILSTDFNNGIPTGWQTIDNDNLTPNSNASVSFMTQAWNLVENTDSLNIGDSILVATSWFQNGGTADDFLISPPITLGNYGNFISFDLKSIDASNPDGFEVLYSTSGTSVNDFIYNPKIYSAETVSPYWTNYSVEIEALNNQTIHLAFRHVATDKFVLALDNISVSINDPVSINENNKTAYSFYPNPTKEFITFNNISKNTRINITDLNGKIVQSGFTSNNKLKLNLAKGLYLITVNNFTQKLIIE